MPAPDITLVKAFCRVDDESFDPQLPTLINSATDMASHITGRDYRTEVMPAAVQQWVCANVASALKDVDALTTGMIVNTNPLVDRLLDPYRTYQWSPPEI